MKLIAFISLIMLSSSLANAADQGPAEARAEHCRAGRLADLFAMQAADFKREALLYLRVKDKAVDFISEHQAKGIQSDIMKIKKLLDDPVDGCRMRARDIKKLLDKQKIWNRVLYLGVNYKNTANSPFVFGNQWNHHWANLVAVATLDEKHVLMVIDPLICKKNPKPLDQWFNDLVEGDKMYDLVTREANLYRHYEEEDEPELEPEQTDLSLEIVDDIPQIPGEHVGE